MEKYKISDLLLVHEDKLCRVVYQFNRDCRFAVLNKDKTKIKIITKDEVHLVNDPLLKDYTGESQTFAHLYQVYAYETKKGIRAFPIYLKKDFKILLLLFSFVYVIICINKGDINGKI